MPNDPKRQNGSGGSGTFRRDSWENVGDLKPSKPKPSDKDKDKEEKNRNS